MTKKGKFWANALRITLGWFMLFDGISLLTNPDFTSATFLSGGGMFPEFFAWFAQPANLIWVDPLNIWGIILIGVALILGIGTRIASLAGVALMVLYYFAHHAGFHFEHGFIVEEHFIYAVAFLFVASAPAAKTFGLAHFIPNRKKWKWLR